MTKEELIELRNRVLSHKDIPEDEKRKVLAAIDNGQEFGFNTGYASIDRPWNEFYSDKPYANTFDGTTPYQGLLKGNKNHENDGAIGYFGANINYGSLFKSIDSVARSLEEYGAKKSDFVTICSTTTPEVVSSFYAISKIGAVANVISPFYETQELIDRIDECESRLIIIADAFFPKFKSVLNKNKRNNIIVLPLMNSSLLRFITKTYKPDYHQNEVAWNMFLKDGKNREEAKVDGYEVNKPQAMVYSSGTTGAAKGILLSVDSFQKLVNAYGNSGFDVSRGQKVYQNIPPWHSTGLSLGINFPLHYGVKVYTDPRFEHDPFIKNVLKYKPEYILTDTYMYQGFATDKGIKSLKGKSLSFLKYPVEGGEILTEKDIESIEKVFHDHGCSARLLNGYGECECGATVTTDITGHKFSNNASGIPLPKITTVGIFDDDYKELKYGERGNIFVKTEIGMIKYFKKEQETKDFFYTDNNGDVWSQTGDIGYMNSDGSLVVLGRKSDYSIINNEKIYNFDVERSILSTGKVRMCEVQTHPEDDNKLVAHLVLDNEYKKITEENPNEIYNLFEEIQSTVFNMMGKEEAIPYSFCIRESFPKAISGKRGISLIKNNIEGIINIPKPLIKKMVK